MMKYDYDVIVLGAGPVGSYCAYLASNKGLNTLLVEATNKKGGQPLNLYAYKQIVDFPLFSSISAIDFVNKINEQLATEKKIKTVVFDRSGYIYHGVVKQFAESAREAGLEF